MNTIEKTLEYHELIMTLDNLNDVHLYSLPIGYKFVYFMSDADIDDWINIHISTGEFACKSKAREYFYDFYGKFYKQLSKRCIFVVNTKNEKIATATLSPADEYGYKCVIDWFAIRKDYQGKQLSEPILSKLVNLAKGFGYDKILLHTQTHTWLAAKIYLDFGFEPMFFEDKKGWQVLKTLTNHQKLGDFKSLKPCELYDELAVNIKELLDKKFKNYTFPVWYKDNRNDVYVYDYDTNKEYRYKFYNNGKVIEQI